jgi:cytochrome c-type biogenesis protein CcmH/NrfF
VSQHATWATSQTAQLYLWIIPVIILIAWGVFFLLYKKAAQVQGF